MSPTKLTNTPQRLDIVIPMAGRGSRFAEAGYSLPKPLIDVKGEPMIRRVIENLRPNFAHRFIFLVLEEHLRRFELESRLKDWAGPGAVCVPVAQTTEGAACTVLLAREYLSDDCDLMIANSDQLVDAAMAEFLAFSRQEGVEGSIMVFEAEDEKWSFAKLDAQGRVTEVAEKRRISNLATVGIYYFRRGADFVRGADAMIKRNIRVNGEFYVCPVYNETIAAGQNVRVWKITSNQMHGLGTPGDLEKYLAERL